MFLFISIIILFILITITSSSDVEVSDSGVWARRSPKPNWYTGFIEQSRTPYWEKPNNRIPLLWLSAWTHLSRRLIFLSFLFGTKNYMHMNQFKKLYNGSNQGLIIEPKVLRKKTQYLFSWAPLSALFVYKRTLVMCPNKWSRLTCLPHCCRFILWQCCFVKLKLFGASRMCW